MAKTELDDLLYSGVDSKNRRIYFGDYTDQADLEVGEVTSRSVESAVRALHHMLNEDSQKPIELHMSSPGGDPYQMLRLYDEILACPCPVKFIGGGIIASSATWIMCACDERYLHPNTTVMVHDGTEGYEGTHTDAKVAMAEAVRLQDKLYDIYAANSRMPREFWEDVCQRDLYLTAEEALKLGLADKIVEPAHRASFRKARNAALKKSPEPVEMSALMDKLRMRVNRHKP
jgi:ATP-dependent Clp protease protease subunit